VVPGIQRAVMLLYQIKMALRILSRRPGFISINLAGITVGAAVCLLIGLYIQHELSFDRYHLNHKTIYRVANKVEGASYENGIAKVFGPWGPGLAKNLPEVESMCRFVGFNETLFAWRDKRFYESNGFYADSTVLDIFSWKLISGDPKTAMQAPNCMIVTRSFAKKYFADEDPVGKSVLLNNTDNYRITGLMEDVPFNSHFRFDFLASLSSYHHPDMDKWNRWNQFYTYLLLKPGASVKEVERKADAFLARHLDAETAAASTPFLQPLADIHLHSDLFREIEPNSNPSYIYIFGTLALFIIVIACLNFINLSTAQAVKRSAEVGIRKVNGALRRTLLWQFLIETGMVCFISIGFAIALAYIALPYLNNFLENHVSFNGIYSKWLAGGLLALFVFITVACGLYPATVLAAYNPIRIMGKQSSGKSPRHLLRKILVTCQFCISIVMIIAALVTWKQLNYIQNKNLGFNKDQILIIPIRNNETLARLETVKHQLKQVPGVQEITASANRPGGSDFGIPCEVEGIPADQQPPMRMLVVDQDFLATYQIELAAGRGFSKQMPTDTAAYLINEEAARQLGFDNPIGKMVKMPNIGRESAPIIGVVKDFHFRSLHEKIMPLLFFVEAQWFGQLSVRINAPETAATIESISKIWPAIEPGHPFSYSFFDEDFADMYAAETRTATIIGIFSVLAIFIACLGLLGLVNHITQQRLKEIGIRKVLGSSVSSIVYLLSSDFVRLVLIATVIAFPLAWWAMNNWLQDFAYRTNIHWWIFATAGVLTLMLTLLTVVIKAVSAAHINPAKVLKAE